MRTGSILAIQRVHKGRQLLCVHLLRDGRMREAFSPPRDPVAATSALTRSHAPAVRALLRVKTGLTEPSRCPPAGPYSPLPQN